MSSLAIRIGNNFKRIHKCLHGDDLISSFKSFQSKSNTNGVNIAEMSSCSTGSVKDEKEENSESKKDETTKGQHVFILEELVIKTANVRIQSELLKHRYCFQKTEQPDFTLDWSELEVISAKPNFEPVDLNDGVQEAIRVISNTMLKNGSKVSQWHKIKTERQILSACESSLTKGCVIGGKIGIPLPAPDALGFSSGFSLKRPLHNYDQEIIAWVGTDCIKIPKGDTITVTIQSKSQQKEFNFTAIIGVKGAVYAVYDEPNTNTTVRLPISIRDIFREQIPTLINKEENDTIYFINFGRCRFKYDVNHEIICDSINLI